MTYASELARADLPPVPPPFDPDWTQPWPKPDQGNPGPAHQDPDWTGPFPAQPLPDYEAPSESG